MRNLAAQSGLMALMIVISSACHRTPPPDELIMLTSPDYCPYEFRVRDNNGKTDLAGFDIEVARTIAEELEVPLTIEPQHFNSIMPALNNQQADFAMAAITPTPNRREIVDFSDIYYTQTLAIVSRSAQPFPSLESLIKKTVGVKADSFQAQDLTRYSDIQQTTFKTAGELIAAVKARQVDAGILDQAIVPKYVTPASQLEWAPVPLVSDSAGVAIAFSKNSSSNLRVRIDDVLNAMKTDGRMTSLIHKWFDDYQCPRDDN